LWGSVAAVLLFGVLIPQNELNDQFVSYFNKRIDFRNDTDHIMDNLTGIYAVEHSLGAAGSGGISEPEYLAKLDEFSEWYRQQPEVMHVFTFSDIMKRLNKNLHGDDASYYRVPDNRELAAQYLLLYEMSLPYGLDLNNQINIDKSATRFTATLANVKSNSIKGVAERAEQWLRDNAPETMYATGSGPSVMFSYIAERNIKSMLLGTGLAIVLIAITLVVALRSFKFGLLSLVPNLVPAILAFGTWGLLVGEIGLALSVVTAMTLGIVVDDSVHFITKYLRARRVKQLAPDDSVRYAFSTVGRALVVTTMILVAGFLVLSFSSFKLNSGMGQLTAITITFALIADFLLLPGVLMLWADRKKHDVNEKETYNDVAQVAAQG
jgi:predicted RND superfamily exporter protein